MTDDQQPSAPFPDVDTYADPSAIEASRQESLRMDPLDHTLATNLPDVLGLDDLARMPGVEWVVDGVVQEREGTYLYGGKAAMKSTVTLDLLLHVAAGRAWRGREVRRGHVLYVVLENADALPGRVKAWRELHPEADLGDRFHYTVHRFRVTEAEDWARLAAVCRQLPERPAVVAIDTQQRFQGSLAENEGTDTQRIIDLLDGLRERGHTRSTLLVHHSGKDTSRGHRGHTNLPASHTVVLSVAKKNGHEGDTVTLTAEDVNNAPSGWTLRWDARVAAGSVALTPAATTASPAVERMEAVLAALTTAGDGCSKQALTDALDGIGTERKREWIEEAEKLGVIVNRGKRSRYAWHRGPAEPATAATRPD